jgi:hypothetical protein
MERLAVGQIYFTEYNTILHDKIQYYLIGTVLISIRMS